MKKIIENEEEIKENEEKVTNKKEIKPISIQDKRNWKINLITMKVNDYVDERPEYSHKLIVQATISYKEETFVFLVNKSTYTVEEVENILRENGYIE